MTGFDERWLSLREPLDAASRSPAIAAALTRVLTGRPLHVTDLASGTGANLRYLAPILGGRQDWRLVDHDPSLLEAVGARMSEWSAQRGARVTHRDKGLLITGRDFECGARLECRDLAADLATIDLTGSSLVTASALLDLVSGSWLQRLVAHCLAARATVLFALSYDGRMSFAPTEPEDERLRELVNQHQIGDKGFGGALGPRAGRRAAETLAEAGYRVELARSDWRIGPGERALQEALLATWSAAAAEIAPDQAKALESWGRRRRAHIANATSELRVGHADVLGWLPGAGGSPA